MSWWLVLAVFLFLISAFLIIAEVFVPSGGIISICALVCLIAGIFLFFKQSLLAGWIGIGISVIMVPTVLVFAYKIFPHTSFGRHVTLSPPTIESGEGIPDQSNLKELEGDTATVISPLRPVGMCDFSGQRVECVAESGYIEKGAEVRVIRVEGSVVTVRLI